MGSPQIVRTGEVGLIRSHRDGFRVDGSDELLVRVRPGAYATLDGWRTATPEERMIARAHALTATTSGVAVFSHETAAALHGMPLYRADRDRVHITVPPARPGAAIGTVRHRGELGDDDVEIVQGLPCTSLVRTVADMARKTGFESAVVVADAALRRVSMVRNGEHRPELADAFRESARAIAHRSAQGVSRGDRVLSFADGRAQLPGESISRIRIAELGFHRVRLQVGVQAPDGRWYWVDFAFDDPGAEGFGEFDGAIKYVDGRMLDGRTSAQAFDAEKQREDWIRGRTQRRFARWGWPHVRTAQTLGRRLAAFGIRPPA